jgi:hypothetical protein
MVSPGVRGLNTRVRNTKCEQTLKLFCAMHGFVQNRAVYVQMFCRRIKKILIGFKPRI